MGQQDLDQSHLWLESAQAPKEHPGQGQAMGGHWSECASMGQWEKVGRVEQEAGWPGGHC